MITFILHPYNRLSMEEWVTLNTGIYDNGKKKPFLSSALLLLFPVIKLLVRLVKTVIANFALSSVCHDFLYYEA